MAIAVPVAELVAVSKIYRHALGRGPGVAALTDVSLQIQPGEIFGLAGPNRAGKTTLLKTILLLCRPTSGDVYRFGQPGHRRATLARVGYVHESQAFPPYLTATSLLHYYGALSQLPKRLLRARIPVVLDQVGLADRRNERISRFSKGMLGRLALAQAILNDPDLLVLDEPTEGLDQEGRRMLYDTIELQRKRGKTALLVTHLLGDINNLCDRVGVLNSGRLTAVGKPSTVLDDFPRETAMDPQHVSEPTREEVCV